MLGPARKSASHGRNRVQRVLAFFDQLLAQPARCETATLEVHEVTHVRLCSTVGEEVL
jgi:hypothetical protein